MCIRDRKSTDEINAEIEKISDSLIAEFKQNMNNEGYQDIMIKHEVINTTDDYFTLKLMCYQAAGSGYEMDYYYTIDLKTGERLALKDLFKEGSDYITPISENIKSQMRGQMDADENVSYWLDDTEVPEWNFTSINDVTFSAMERANSLFGKATFVMDRGYDDNKMFLKLDSMGQDYVIRLTAKRKLLYHNKWTFATELRNRRKGKVKLPLFYKGKEHEAYLSHVKVQITASRKDIYLVLVYGITEHPMMLATNKEIKSKEDVIKVARTYFSRWKIEEYFRCKKQIL